LNTKRNNWAPGREEKKKSSGKEKSQPKTPEGESQLQQTTGLEAIKPAREQKTKGGKRKGKLEKG